MPLEAKKALARRYFEDAPYNPDTCDEIFAPKVLFHALVRTDKPEITSSPKGEKEAYAKLKSVWGDLRIKIDEVIAEGDRVVVVWTSTSVHQGEYQGMPATGKQVINRGINIFRIENGRIAEVWDTWDRLGVWQQLGVLPDLKTAVGAAAANRAST